MPFGSSLFKDGFMIMTWVEEKEQIPFFCVEPFLHEIKIEVLVTGFVNVCLCDWYGIFKVSRWFLFKKHNLFLNAVICFVSNMLIVSFYECYFEEMLAEVNENHRWCYDTLCSHMFNSFKKSLALVMFYLMTF